MTPDPTRIWALYMEGSLTVIALHRAPTGYVLRRMTSCGEVVSHTVSGHYDAMLLAAEWIARDERERTIGAHPWQDTALEAGALTTDQEVR